MKKINLSTVLLILGIVAQFGPDVASVSAWLTGEDRGRGCSRAFGATADHRAPSPAIGCRRPRHAARCACSVGARQARRPRASSHAATEAASRGHAGHETRDA
jgi:hypothetical protein